MIRAFNIDDSERCIQIIERCFDLSVDLEEPAKSYVKRIYTHPDYFKEKSSQYPLFVAEQGGLVIALGGIEGNEIKKLYVDPSCHGLGNGSEMLHYLEHYGIQNGLNEFLLRCFRNSQGFYQKHGYLIVGGFNYERNGIIIPTIEMRKRVA